MKSRVNPILRVFFSLTLLLSTVWSVPVQGGRASFPAARGLSNSLKAETEWRRVTPQGEEFSILTPVAPTLCKQGGDYLIGGSDGSGQRVLDHRSYGGYVNSFIFYIESFKTARPKNLLKVLDDERYPLRVFEDEIKIEGHDAKQYRLTHGQYYGKYFEVVTKKHVYLITLASRGEDNTSVARFISALSLGDNLAGPAALQVLDVRDNPTYKSALLSEAAPVGETAPAQLTERIYKPSEASRKAVIVSRPEPVYTEEARQKQVMGTVVLRGVFGADGQVRNLRVKQGLKEGLTGKAIEAALSIRFFPAEKDGQLVSQYIQIEYNFNLY